MFDFLLKSKNAFTKKDSIVKILRFYNLLQHVPPYLAMPAAISGKFYFSTNSDLMSATEESVG